jgi:hypothetical protein
MEVRIMFNRVINTFLVAAVLFLIHTPATIFAQRETRDRPDSVGSRSIGGKDGTQRRREEKANVQPATKVDEQLLSNPNINVGKMRAAITAAGAPGAPTAEDAIQQARNEYENKFKRDLTDPTFANSHAAIRLEDFARAYIIALNPVVNRKLGGYQLAVYRSMTTTYGGYEEILSEKVPELDEKTAKSLVAEAKKVVKAALSK